MVVCFKPLTKTDKDIIMMLTLDVLMIYNLLNINMNVSFKLLTKPTTRRKSVKNNYSFHKVKH